MLRVIDCSAVCVLVLSLIASANETAVRQLDPAEVELAALSNELYTTYTIFRAAVNKIEDEAKREIYYVENDPANTYVPKLVEFEKAHRKTHAGLMAVRELIRLGCGGGPRDNPGDLGRRQALQVLFEYRNADELPEIIRLLSGGNPEPQCETLFRSLIDAKDISELNRTFAKFMLARWSLDMCEIRDYLVNRLKRIEMGEPLRYLMEKQFLSDRLSLLPPSEKLATLENEAIKILESVSVCHPALRQPAMKALDAKWRIVCVDSEKTNSMPLLKDLAAGLLFTWQSLGLGKTAPELILTLTSGEEWSLAKQLGKPVIIQFSFKGCGPCEAMYPDLRSLRDEYQDRLGILTIMADEEQSTTLEAIKSGKVTWCVHWDGHRGPIATKWAVTSFPTVYIVDADGKIAAKDIRDVELKKKIAELIR